MPQLSPAYIRLLCTIGSSMTTPATGDQAEREMIALGLVRHITSGHAIGLTLTAAGRMDAALGGCMRLVREFFHADMVAVAYCASWRGAIEIGLTDSEVIVALGRKRVLRAPR